MHAHPQATPQRVLTALAITAAFMLAEAATGVLANSLALVTDAVHNLSDVVALALSWYALRLALRPAHAGKTYGYHRAGILVALVNSSVLIGHALVSFFQAYQRLLDIAARADAEEGTRPGLEDARQGNMRPAREFFEAFEASHRIRR